MTEPPPVVLRKATSDDAPVLGRLGALLVTLHHAYDRERFLAAGPGTEAGYGGYLASQIGREGVILLVAEAADAVVGYAYAGLEGVDWMALRGPAGVIYDLVVEPARRRGGIGRALLEATLAALAGLGAPRVVLSTATRNDAAQRLFTLAGFRPTMLEMTREGAG
jgi:ribosomal protein S18 acetylase RimI-like enzyme